jgi:hypothetical protein
VRRCDHREVAESVGIYVIDGGDIRLFANPVDAAASIEGYDAADLDYLGTDGSVWQASVEGPEWGPVTLHRTADSRPDLVTRLEAAGWPVTGED